MHEPAPRADSVLSRLRERTDRLMADAFGSESPSRRGTELNDRSHYTNGNGSFGANANSPPAQQQPRRDSSARADGLQAPFLYGSFYSTAAYVVYFMLRAMPQWMLLLQGGRWDKPQRLFDSVPAAFASAMSGPTDVKELIPEFYEIPADATSWRHVFAEHAGEFEASRQRAACGAFLSLRECVTQQRRAVDGSGAAAGDDADVLALYDFGMKDDGTRVRGDVELPAWAATSGADEPCRRFVLEHRRALESDYVSRHLHHWIDLIFGCKQRGAAAWAAHNVFHPQCYEADAAPPEDGTEDDDAIAAHRQHFGQVPRQVFFEPHPRRRCADSVTPRHTVPLNVALQQACAAPLDALLSPSVDAPLPERPASSGAVDALGTPSVAAVAIASSATAGTLPPTPAAEQEQATSDVDWDTLAPNDALVKVSNAPEVTPEEVRQAEQMDVLALDSSTVGVVFTHGPRLHIRVAGCEDDCDMPEVFGAGFTAAAALSALHFPQETAVMVVSPAGEVAAGVWTPLIGWRVYHCVTHVAVAAAAANSLCVAPPVEMAAEARTIVPVVFCGAHVAALVAARDAAGTITITIDKILSPDGATAAAHGAWCRPLGERAASFSALTAGGTLAATLAITQDDGAVAWLPRRFKLPAAVGRVTAVWSRLPVEGAPSRPPRGPTDVLLEWFDLVTPQGIVTCRRRVAVHAAKAGSSSESDTDADTDKDAPFHLDVVSVAAAPGSRLACAIAAPVLVPVGDESSDLPSLVTCTRGKHGVRMDSNASTVVQRVAVSAGADTRIWCAWPFVACVTRDDAMIFMRAA
jgi:hypothetical protein